MTRVLQLLTRSMAIAVLLACAAGCGNRVAGTGSASHRPVLAALPADQILFQVSSGGGFTSYDWALANRPELTIYPDGSAYLSSPTTAGGPRRFRVGHINPGVLSHLVAAAARSDLFDGVNFGMPPISDLNSTLVRFRPDSTPERTASAYALSVSSDDGSLTPSQREHRIALRALIARLRHSVIPTSMARWTPSRIDVTAVDLPGRDPSAPAWPGPALHSLLVKTDRGRCAELTGSDASTVWTAALRNDNGLWSESGTVHHLVIRALLPGEPACRGMR